MDNSLSNTLIDVTVSVLVVIDVQDYRKVESND